MCESSRDYTKNYSAAFMGALSVGMADVPVVLRLYRRTFTCIETPDDAAAAAELVGGSCHRPDYDSISTCFIERMRMLGYYGITYPVLVAAELKARHNTP